MSANNNKGFTHEKVETSNFLMIVLILLVVAVGGLVEIVPLFFQKSTTDAVQGVEPYQPLQLMGRDVYIREGCYNCHSQMIRPFRKPLVLFTPKSLLRNKAATSPLSDLSEGSKFQPIIAEVNEDIKSADVTRLLVCSGKVYYDLVAEREALQRGDVAVVRVEQLYPFAHKSFQSVVQQYPNLKEVVWVQDEPQNQGAWFYIQHHLIENMAEGQKLSYAGRPASASPAVGYLAKHQEQHKALLEQAFSPRIKGFSLVK